MRHNDTQDLVVYRRAFHEYEILDTLEAGIVLLGTEIKSLRNHGGSLQDAFVIVSENGAWLRNASIAPYRWGNVHNHEERRPRKLLLHKREINRLRNIQKEKGLAIIPIAIYLKNGFVKIKIACGRGKKLYDKRAALKKKEHQRSIDRGYQL